MRVLAAAIVLALAAVVGRQAVAAEPPLAALTLVGPPEVVFASRKDACDGHDVPDAPVRAFVKPLKFPVRMAAGGMIR